MPCADDEASILDEQKRTAVEMASARDAAPCSVQQVLPAAAPRLCGPLVLDEQQAAARFQDAANLAERAARVRDGAQRVGYNGRVYASVRQRQCLCPALDKLDPQPDV